MPAFKAEKVRVIEDGRLHSAGVRWSQANIFAEKAYDALCVIGLMVAGILFGLSRIVVTGSESFTLASFTVMAVTGTLVLLSYVENGRPTAVIFHDDGRIETPHGSPGFRRDRSIDGHHRYISNIQLQQGAAVYKVDAAQCFEVGLYCANGDIVVVADFLRKNQAHKVAVMLTNALNDMRAQQAELPGKRQSTPDPRRPLKPALID